MKQLALTLFAITFFQFASAQFTFEVIDRNTHPNWNEMCQAMYDNVESTVVDDSSGMKYCCIVDVPDTSKQDLMSRARIFFAENYGRGDKVTDLDDENAGVIIAKSTDHTVRVDIKDSKVKIEVRPSIITSLSYFRNKKGRIKWEIVNYYNISHHTYLSVITELQQAILQSDNW